MVLLCGIILPCSFHLKFTKTDKFINKISCACHCLVSMAAHVTPAKIIIIFCVNGFVHACFKRVDALFFA
ncbi:hypothetical protein D1164_00985 [Mariniphaga sediminis]|uniref:Uncharacterized protein n=1 Tax=Mariniphaga sediminis TaxID=1628158 RepID=A0A399D5W9_9BACT|nr:hypothetical protein D1164_00985 [Mariniphaga sediminis]